MKNSMNTVCKPMRATRKILFIKFADKFDAIDFSSAAFALQFETMNQMKYSTQIPIWFCYQNNSFASDLYFHFILVERFIDFSLLFSMLIGTVLNEPFVQGSAICYTLA